MTDNDRELLEWAARAAGMDCRMRYCEPCNGMSLYTPQDGYFGSVWNPLSDDGDAFRLVVRLKHLGRWAPVREEVITGWADDPYAATRRALVRAAAEVGKGMRPFPTADEIDQLAGMDDKPEHMK